MQEDYNSLTREEIIELMKNNKEQMQIITKIPEDVVVLDFSREELVYIYGEKIIKTLDSMRDNLKRQN